MTAVTVPEISAKARTKRHWNGLILPAVLILVWEAASQSGVVDARLLPSLGTIAGRTWNELAEGRLAVDIAASLARDLTGFAIGSALGVGEAAKIAFIALTTFTPVVVNTWAGARSVPRDLAEVAQVLTLSRWQRLTWLAIPWALPSIFVGLHLGLIYSWLATVGAEYFMTIGPGIGGLMTEGREHFHMDLVILGVVLLGGIGLGLNRLATVLETHVLSWKQH
jgi:sulfonate transport system permease protein